MNRTKKFILIFLASNLFPAVALGADPVINRARDLSVGELGSTFIDFAADIQTVGGAKFAVLHGTVFTQCKDKFEFHDASIHSSTKIGIRVHDKGGGVQCMTDLVAKVGHTCDSEINGVKITCEKLPDLRKIPLGATEGEFKLLKFSPTNTMQPYSEESFKNKPEHLSEATLEARREAKIKADDAAEVDQLIADLKKKKSATDCADCVTKIERIRTLDPTRLDEIDDIMVKANDHYAFELAEEAKDTYESSNGGIESPEDDLAIIEEAIAKIDEALLIEPLSLKMRRDLKDSRAELLKSKKEMRVLAKAKKSEESLEEIRDELREDPTKANRSYAKLLRKLERSVKAECRGKKGSSEDCLAAQASLTQAAALPDTLRKEAYEKQQAQLAAQQQAQQPATTPGPGQLPNYNPSLAPQPFVPANANPQQLYTGAKWSDQAPYSYTGIPTASNYQRQPVGVVNGLNGIPTAQQQPWSYSGVPTSASTSGEFWNMPRY